MLEIILVQDFRPLKIKSTQFPSGFCLKLSINNKMNYCRQP